MLPHRSSCIGYFSHRGGGGERIQPGLVPAISATGGIVGPLKSWRAMGYPNRWPQKRHKKWTDFICEIGRGIALFWGHLRWGPIRQLPGQAVILYFHRGGAPPRAWPFPYPDRAGIAPCAVFRENRDFYVWTDPAGFFFGSSFFGTVFGDSPHLWRSLARRKMGLKNGHDERVKNAE